MFANILRTHRRLQEVGFSEEQSESMILEIVSFLAEKSRAKLDAAEPEPELEYELAERLARAAGIGKYAS